VNGFLYDSTDEAALAAGVRRIANEPELCKLIRTNARQHAENWSWAAATQQLLGFYGKAMTMPRFHKPKRASAPWMLAVKRAAIGGMKVFLS
jgi:hypothetical protein